MQRVTDAHLVFAPGSVESGRIAHGFQQRELGNIAGLTTNRLKVRRVAEFPGREIEDGKTGNPTSIAKPKFILRG